MANLQSSPNYIVLPRIPSHRIASPHVTGSEKWDPVKDQQLCDAHVTEMTNINLSLHTLGRCIAALADRLEKEKARCWVDCDVTQSTASYACQRSTSIEASNLSP